MKSLTLYSEDDEAEGCFTPVALPRGIILSRKRKSPSFMDGAKRSCCTSDSPSSEAEGETPSLRIVVQPEKYFRARYTSEGSRGPMRGGQDGGYPTVKVSYGP
eukprot:scpid38739/ scgid12844/ 